MIRGIDHVALNVRDLDTAVRDYETILGCEPNWRGAAHGARHAWFQLGNMALDIIAPDDTAQIDKHGEGIWGLGFAVTDLDAARKTLERRGVAMLEPGVTVSCNEAGAERRWTIAAARRKSMHGIAAFLVAQAGDPWPLCEPVGAAVTGLDHIVIHTPNPERAAALYGARLGLDLRLDRSNEQWGSRLLFFRCGDAVVEIGASLKAPVSDAPDNFGGLAWRVRDADEVRARIAKAGIDVSEIRAGRKQGTRVFTVRNRTSGVPTLMIEKT